MQIEWRKRAYKQLLKLDRMHQKKIVAAVDGLQDWPNCQKVKALTNYEYSYRLRVGSYRIFFEVSDILRIITIEEVKKRDERTY